MSYLLYRLDPRLRPQPPVPQGGRPAREVEIEAQRAGHPARVRAAGFFGAP